MKKKQKQENLESIDKKVPTMVEEGKHEEPSKQSKKILFNIENDIIKQQQKQQKLKKINEKIASIAEQGNSEEFFENPKDPDNGGPLKGYADVYWKKSVLPYQMQYLGYNKDTKTIRIPR